MDQTLAADKYPLNLTGDLAGTTKQQKTSFLDPYYSNKRGGLPAPVSQLGDKADLTPSPLLGSGSHEGRLTGETNDVVRSYVFALTEQVSVTLLIPRRNHCSPNNPKKGVELSGIEPLSETLVWIT